MTDEKIGMTEKKTELTEKETELKAETAGGVAVPDIESVWKGIVEWQGRTLLTKSGLPFTYSVKEKSIFIDRKKKTITKSTIDRALEKMREQGGNITGPKALGMFGAPYIWAIFTELGIVDA